MKFDYRDKKDLGCGVEPVMSSREDIHDSACVTHDFRYVEHDKSRKEADKEFLDNMLRINKNNATSATQKFFWDAGAYLRYGAVRLFGSRAYKE